MEVEQFRWIGKPVSRVEDERLMRGAGRYIDDLDPFPGCKVAAIVRSPYAHAFIRSIDAEEALQVPGVVGVITGADVRREMRPFPVGVPEPVEYYPMAIDKVRFTGPPPRVTNTNPATPSPARTPSADSFEPSISPRATPQAISNGRDGAAAYSHSRYAVSSPNSTVPKSICALPRTSAGAVRST